MIKRLPQFLRRHLKKHNGLARCNIFCAIKSELNMNKFVLSCFSGELWLQTWNDITMMVSRGPKCPNPSWIKFGWNKEKNIYIGILDTDWWSYSTNKLLWYLIIVFLTFKLAFCKYTWTELYLSILITLQKQYLNFNNIRMIS